MPINTDTHHTRIELKPHEIYSNLDDNIMKALKNKVLNKCINIGYVSKIHNIVRRSKGVIRGEDFEGSAVFNIWYLADVINYTEGDPVYGFKIDRIDKYGIHMSKNGNITGYIEGSNLPTNYIDEFSKGDVINVVVLGSIYNVNSTKIELLADQLHYYSVYPIKKQMTILYNRESIDNNKVNNIEKNITFEKEYGPLGEHELGFDHKLLDIYNKTDKLSDEEYTFYSKLSNPFQFISDVINNINKTKPKGEHEISVVKALDKIKNVVYLELYEILKNFDNVIDISKNNNVLSIGDPKETSEYINCIKEYSKNIRDSKIAPKNVYNTEKNLDGVSKKYNKKKLSLIISSAYNTKDLLNIVINSLEIQDVNGSLVCKISDTYDITNAEIIYILSMFYKNVILFKPYIIPLHESEKYIVATYFLGLSKTQLDAFKDINNDVQKNKGFPVKLFTTSILDDLFTKKLFSSNNKLLKYQYNKIDEIINLSKLYTQKDRQIDRYLECQKSIAFGYLESLELI